MAKTLEQKLCSRSLGYSFVRNVFVYPALRLFYRKIDVIGAKDVPDSGPVIFTPNHQNALMDALMILCTKDRQPVFVARADIFEKPLIVAALNFLRILPVYRKRDGGNSFDNNRETFDLILKALRSRQAVGMMPEGTHSEIKRLRMLQKGVFRLAMQAQEEYGNRPMVKIVPVGIEYTSTSKFRSDVTVRYGKAIEVSDFYDQYVENPARAFKHMQDTLSEKMKEGMVNITNELYYREIEHLRVLYQRQAMQRLGLDCRNAEHRLRAQQKIIAALQEYDQTNPDEMSALCLAVRDYLTIIQKYSLRDWVVEHQPYSLTRLLVQTIWMIPGIPFWILGMLFNYIPYKLSALASRKVKDPQFVSSVQFVAGMVVYPLYDLIMIVLFVLFVPCIWGKFIMPLLLIPLGLFAYQWYLAMKKLGARFRFWSGKRNKSPEILKAIEWRKKIFEIMDRLAIHSL
ncbi:MAG: 1-acyl-sn-glycerol-3-phosphate acyltransferase [Bacteroidales bacterium]|jgi:1-acyl-sn-glycerol-3-phosphate acyltransferase|nr:1-acyl-sn-glycerol-3-phosphate acyltransferase [Bacteroidales bacterium]